MWISRCRGLYGSETSGHFAHDFIACVCIVGEKPGNNQGLDFTVQREFFCRDEVMNAPEVLGFFKGFANREERLAEASDLMNFWACVQT